MLFVKLFGHTDKPLEETIFSVIWVDNAADGDMEMQNEIYGELMEISSAERDIGRCKWRYTEMPVEIRIQGSKN